MGDIQVRPLVESRAIGRLIEAGSNVGMTAKYASSPLNLRLKWTNGNFFWYRCQWNYEPTVTLKRQHFKKIPARPPIMRLLISLLCQSRWAFVAVLLYILSFPPYVALVNLGETKTVRPYYRAPLVFRPLEWLALKTPLSEPLLIWADVWDSRDLVSFQIWYCGQGIDKPGEQIEFIFAR